MKANREKRPKVRHIYSLMCETLLFAKDKRLSLINVIGNVRLATIPGGLSALGFICSFHAPVGEVFSLAVEGPKRELVFKTDDTAVESPGSDEGVPNVIQSNQIGILVGPIIFKQVGIHHIVLRVRGRVIHREPFGVFVDPSLSLGEPKDASGNPGKTDASTAAAGLDHRPGKRRGKHPRGL